MMVGVGVLLVLSEVAPERASRELALLMSKLVLLFVCDREEFMRLSAWLLPLLTGVEVPLLAPLPPLAEENFLYLSIILCE